MRRLTVLSLLMVLAVNAGVVMAQHTNTASMRVTARVVPAPQPMELAVADSVQFDTSGSRTSLAMLRLPEPGKAGFLLSLSRVTLTGMDGYRQVAGILKFRDRLVERDMVAYDILAEMKREEGAQKVHGGVVTATIEYY